METQLINETSDYLDNLPQATHSADLEVMEFDRQLEKFYITLKRMQSYCITINTTPNLNWESFMAVYRCNLDAVCDANMEDILSGKNQQKQLREYTDEYFCNLSLKLNTVFHDIEDFSELFIEFHTELERSIKDTLQGSTDQDYQVPIDELLQEIQHKKQNNNTLFKTLTAFSNKLEITFKLLRSLKSHAEIFLAEKNEAIVIEQELAKLEKELDQEQAKAIANAYKNKMPISFRVYKNQKCKLTKEKNKEEAKTIIEKIDKLKRELMDYESDYANLSTIFRAATHFRAGIFSFMKEVKEVYQSWVALEEFFTDVNELEKVEKSYVEKRILPALTVLRDRFKEIETIIKTTKNKKMFAMDITFGEEDNKGNFVVKSTSRVNTGRALEYHLPT